MDFKELLRVWLLTTSIVEGVQHIANTANMMLEVLTNCKELSFSFDMLFETPATYRKML